jgi:hypothetical protein
LRNRLQQPHVCGIYIIHLALAKRLTNTLLHLLTSTCFRYRAMSSRRLLPGRAVMLPLRQRRIRMCFNHSVTLPPTYSSSTPTLPITSQSKTDTAIFSPFTTATTTTEAGGAATGAANTNNVMDTNMGLFYIGISFQPDLVRCCG